MEAGADIRGYINNPLSVLTGSSYFNIEVIRYLLEKGVNPNLHSIFSACIYESYEQKRNDVNRGDLVRILLSYGYIYEYKFEYIDKETKQ